jgi:hypothetical protein
MKENEIVPSNSNNSGLSLNIPDGQGKFEKGVDGRGNPYQKFEYDNGDYIKQEILKSGECKLTAKKKIK